MVNMGPQRTDAIRSEDQANLVSLHSITACNLLAELICQLFDGFHFGDSPLLQIFGPFFSSNAAAPSRRDSGEKFN